MAHVPKKFNLDEFAIENGRMRKENGTVVNRGDRIDTVVGQYKSYELTVTPAGTLVVDPDTTEALTGRHTVYLINDSSALIFANFDSIPDPSFANLTAFSGESIIYNLDPHVPRDIFVRTELFNSTMRIIEVATE